MSLPTSSGSLTLMKLLTGTLLVLSSIPASAQLSSSAPPQVDAPSATLPTRPSTALSERDKVPAGAFDNLFRVSVMCGLGASTSTLSTKPAAICGFGFNMLPMLVTEFGIMAPQANRSYLSAYMSNDLVLHVAPKATRNWRGHPIVLGGYTRMFETGHAIDFGVGYEFHRDDMTSLSFELRDYYTFANPTQHNVFLRVGYVTQARD